MGDETIPLVAPFAGERYAAHDRLRDLIAPPYDVITADERAELAARDRHNIVHLVLADARDGYAGAANALAQWRAEGVIRRDPAPSVTVMQQEFLTPDGRTHVRTGVIAGVHVEPYDRGRVRPHERTHRGPRDDRLALARATGTSLETIFVMARDTRGHLRRRLEGVTRHEPTALAELNGVGIGIWRVGGVQAREIAHVAGEGPLYVADGHHRFETANAYRAENHAAVRIPALIVPVGDPGLIVLPTHRIIRGGVVAADAVLARWQRGFAVEQREAELDLHGLLAGLDGSGAAAVVVLPEGRLYALTGHARPENELEIAVIEREVVQPLHEAAGTSSAVEYTANPGEVFDVVGRGAASAGILVRPTPIDRVLEVADRGGVLPPKSTYFIPKVPSGIVLLGHGDQGTPV